MPADGPLLDPRQVANYLPHRYPFLLVDRVEEIVSGERILATKNVTWNEPYFTGHFPGDPVMPGVLQVEALAQAAEEKPRLLLGRGAALKALQRLEEAENAYLEALQFDSTYVEAWFNLGNLYLATGRRSAAETAYRQVVKSGADADLLSRATNKLKQLKP